MILRLKAQLTEAGGTTGIRTPTRSELKKKEKLMEVRTVIRQMPSIDDGAEAWDRWNRAINAAVQERGNLADTHERRLQREPIEIPIINYPMPFVPTIGDSIWAGGAVSTFWEQIQWVTSQEAGSTAAPMTSVSDPQHWGYVHGVWTIPTVTFPNNDQIMLTWVGLDGLYGAEGLLQVGVYQQFNQSENQVGTSVFYEWVNVTGPGSTRPPGFPVAPGDIIECSAMYSLSNQGQVEPQELAAMWGVVWINNRSNPDQQPFLHFIEPGGISARGFCAEWILEQQGGLADYESVSFTEAYALLYQSVVTNPLPPPTRGSTSGVQPGTSKPKVSTTSEVVQVGIGQESFFDYVVMATFNPDGSIEQRMTEATLEDHGITVTNI